MCDAHFTALLRNLLFLIRFQSNCNPLDELHVLTFVGKITQRINRILVCLQITLSLSLSTFKKRNLPLKN